MTFTNAQDYARSLFRAIQFQKDNRVEMVPYEFMVSPDSGGENDFRILASSIDFVI